MHCRVANVERQVLGALLNGKCGKAGPSGKCGKAGLRCIVEWQMWERRS